MPDITIRLQEEITKRKLAEDMLRENKRVLLELQMSTGLGTFVLDIHN
jgi:hypothetical protein